MKKPYAEIPGFKKLDAALRDAISSHKAVIIEIEKSRKGRRSQDELKALLKIELVTQTAMSLASKARSELWENMV